MAFTAYAPLDPFRYKRDERSTPFSRETAPGLYVYVQDTSGIVWICPDGPHRHPRILGGARPCVAAGELTLGDQGLVLTLNNLSGTFQCHRDSLLTAVGGIIAQGGICSADAITRYEA